MKINIDGREYSFKFYHNNPAQPKKGILDIKGIDYNAPLERGTMCIVFNENGEEVTRGVANVHPKDNFNKEKGRQISLKRSIESWDKPYKSQVWQEYRNWGKARW